jgi:Protein of unknown function (DUF2442)
MQTQAYFPKHTEAKALVIKTLYFDTQRCYFEYTDGRIFGFPLAWFPRLMQSTENQRLHWRLIGEGQGVHWEDLDEDISAEVIFYTPSF